MRFGLHSGPVTAGVLQGERARFQLFGDTVNTAARMESTGSRNKIQVSPSTYEELVNAGKAQWLRPRIDEVHAKGKGSMKTYWLDPNAKKGSSQGSSSVTGDSSEAASGSNANDMSTPKTTKLAAKAAAKQDRLIDWIVDLMSEHIRVRTVLFVCVATIYSA